MARFVAIAFAVVAVLCAMAAPVAAQTITSVTLSGSGTRYRGQTYTVTWVNGGSIPNVRFRVCTNSGTGDSCGTAVATVASMANTNSYSYTMGNFPAATYYIEISPTTAPTSTRYSSGFSLAAAPSSISITSPGTMTRGSTKTIAWTVTGTITTVNITLLLSSTVVSQLATRVDSTGSAPSFTVTVPAAITSGSFYRVRIDAVDYSPLHDPTSAQSSYFSVEAASASISITSPGTLTRGANKIIQWTVTGAIRTVNITLLLSSTFVAQIAARVDTTGSAPSFTYAVPATLADGSFYRLRFDAADYDVSIDPLPTYSNYFSVEAAAASLTLGTVGTMERGGRKSISWATVGAIYTVNITLWMSSTFVATIALDAPNTNGFDYSVPATLPENSFYRVRIESFRYAPEHNPVVSFSSYFSVDSPSSTITITSPSSSTSGGVSYGLLIAFSCSGFVTGFDVDYMIDSSTTVSIATNLTGTLAADRHTVKANTTWIIPASITPTSFGRVRVRGSIYSAALATPPSTTSSSFSVLTATEYARQQASGGGGTSPSGSSSGGGGGGGGAAIAIIIVLAVLFGAYGFYKKRKEQAAERDMQKMQGLDAAGQAVPAPTPEEQYVTEGIPLCYFTVAQVHSVAPPQPDTLVQPVLIPVTPLSPASPGFSERVLLVPRA